MRNPVSLVGASRRFEHSNNRLARFLPGILVLMMTAVAISGEQAPPRATGAVEEVESPEIPPERVQELLEDFVDDYRRDPMALNAYFGIKIGEDSWWTVSVKRREWPQSPKESADSESPRQHDVSLRSGQPENLTWFFELADANVLERLHEGTLSAGTAYTRSFSSDRTPLNATTMDGYHSDFEDLAQAYHLISHFWTKGIPEVTYFERAKGLPVHGAAMVSLYNMKDKRITWFSIGPEETVNDDPDLEWGQTPNLFIFTSGRGRAQFGEHKMEVREGMSVFIAPFVKHVISNPYDEPLEGILVLFGDNSAFTKGKSFAEFTEDLYEFYGEYPYGD